MTEVETRKLCQSLTREVLIEGLVRAAVENQELTKALNTILLVYKQNDSIEYFNAIEDGKELMKKLKHL